MYEVQYVGVATVCMSKKDPLERQRSGFAMAGQPTRALPQHGRHT